MRHGVIALDRITPLMLAATYGPIEAVRALLDAGAEVNAKNVRGMTPLMFAVSSEVQDPALVKMLLARGARTGEFSKAGDTRQRSGGGARSGSRCRSRWPRRETLAAIASGVLPSNWMHRLPPFSDRRHRHQAARTHGLAVDETASDEFRKIAAAHAQGVAPMTLQLIDPPGAADTVMYALIGMEAAGIEPSPATDAYATYLFRLYRPGRNWWTGGIARAPLEDSSFHRTAVVVKALNRYLPPALAAEYKTAVERIKASLRGGSAITTDDAAMKVLALRYTGAPDAEVLTAAKALESRQRADGGWGGNSALPSNAYATGVAIYALSESGRAAINPQAYRRGAAWLLRTQQADGSWHVPSRSPKFQPYFESGFPYGGDQWISNAGTAWAVAGLTSSMK